MGNTDHQGFLLMVSIQHLLYNHYRLLLAFYWLKQVTRLRQGGRKVQLCHIPKQYWQPPQIPQMEYSYISVLIAFSTCQTLYSLHFDEKKYFSTRRLLGTSHTCQDLSESRRHPTRRDASLFSTHHEFRNKLTMSTEVPLYCPS